MSTSFTNLCLLQFLIVLARPKLSRSTGAEHTTQVLVYLLPAIKSTPIIDTPVPALLVQVLETWIARRQPNPSDIAVNRKIEFSFYGWFIYDES